MSDESKSCATPSNAEPTATRSTVPMWIFSATLVLIYLGTVYFDHHSGWFSAKVYSPYANVDELELYQPKSGAAAQLARGKQVYEQVCGLCHGVDGLGKPGQAPPLAESEFVTAKGITRLTHIPLLGVTGSIKVQGKDWNMAMAAMGAGLSDSDLASVLTYIRTSWGNHAEVVDADAVKAVRATIKSSAPMNGDQLMKMPE